MTNVSYNVRIWSVETRKGSHRNSYHVRWSVNQNRRKKAFPTRALADNFRSKLRTAASEGEGFDENSGLPVSMLKKSERSNWFDFACSYADMKWSSSSPKHRKGIADSLVAITMSMLTSSPGSLESKRIRGALRLAFNRTTRDALFEDHVDLARWLGRNTREVADLSEPEILRSLLEELELKIDGEKASDNTVRLRRTTLTNALDFAVEKALLRTNPMNGKIPKRKTSSVRQVDRRSVPNPDQARRLLAAAGEVRPHLGAFFGLLYYAALRPEEASNIRKDDLSLPNAGWGELHLEQASPEVGKVWADTQTREQRGLKHRGKGVGRVVPCPPELTSLLHDHLRRFGTAPDGRLFRGARDGATIGSSVYGRAWAQARAMVLGTEDLDGSLLAKRPYDLRHAAVSTWLNAGVEATRVAEWAGHSVAVLLRVYAKCLDRGEDAARGRVERALSGAWRENTGRL